MSKINKFRFKYSDAWCNTNKGYYSELELSDNGVVEICFLVNGNQHKIILTNKEEQFIADMDFLNVWNNKCYCNYNVLDGYKWSLSYSYDDISINANGINGFPTDFMKFINLLYTKYDIPKADYVHDDFIKNSIKHTVISELGDSLFGQVL